MKAEGAQYTDCCTAVSRLMTPGSHPPPYCGGYFAFDVDSQRFERGSSEKEDEAISKVRENRSIWLRASVDALFEMCLRISSTFGDSMSSTRGCREYRDSR